MILPVAKITNNYKRPINKKIFCFAYQDDLDQAYAFYCSRYENISWESFMNLGFFEFKKKLGSIPKDEPLYDIIKSRTIELGKIKDKEERKYIGFAQYYKYDLQAAIYQEVVFQKTNMQILPYNRLSIA